MDPDATLEFKPEASLDEVIANYLKAAQAGAAPSAETLIARYPAFTSALAEFLAGQEQLQRLAEPVRAAVTDVASSGTKVRYFGDYELLEEIARGGMGVVYRARQVSLNRIVALKMILAGQFASPEDVQRFHHEAEAVANLDHPNIVPIYEVSEHEGQHYFSMKLVEGGSLAGWIADYRLQIADLPKDEQKGMAQLLATVARAVHHAHQRGILHRDLKPGNILLQSDKSAICNLQSAIPFVTDFGLAKRVEGDAHHTRTGGIVGTPSYMPPEQARSEKVLTTAVDVYSLGAILYELLTSRPPFRAETPLDTVLQVLEREPERPRKFNPRIDQDLETICLKCLDKDPVRRYESAATLAADLEHWLAGEPISARPMGRMESLWRWCRRKPLVIGFTGITAALLASIAIVATFGYFKTSAALDQSNRNLYAAHMNLAQLALNAGNDRRLLNLLEEHIPQEGETDLRGWEWQYLCAQCRIVLDLPLDPTPNDTGLNVDMVTSVAWSPDGTRLASGTSDGVVRIWDVARALGASGRITNRQLVRAVGRSRIPGDEVDSYILGSHQFGLQGAHVYSLAWKPDSQQIASAGADKTIRVWDLATRSAIQTLSGHDGDVLTVSWSRDGKRLASGDKYGIIKIWDAAIWKEMRNIRDTERPHPTTDRAMVIAWDEDDRQLAVAWGGETKFWNANTGQELRSLKGTALAWSLDGRRFADRAGIVDATTGQRQVKLPIAADIEHPVAAWSPDGQRLAAHSGRMTISVWNVATGQEVFVLKGTGMARCAWSPDSRRLATGGHSGGLNRGGHAAIMVCDVAAKNETVTLTGHAGSVRSVTWSPDGRRVASGGEDRIVKVWEVTTAQEVRTLRGHPWQLVSVSWSGDGSYLAALDESGVVKIWDTQTWQEVLSAGLGGVSNYSPGVFSGRLAWSADSRWLAGAGATIKVWESGSWQEVFDQQILGGKGAVVVGWSSEGQRLLINDQDGLKSWDPGTRKRLQILRSFKLGEAVGAKVSSLDGKWIAVVGFDTDIRIWGLKAQESRTLSGHADFVRGLAWGPDSRRLVSASDDGTVRIWDVALGEELLTLQGEPGIGYQSVAFSPDGWRLAASQGNIVKIWDALRQNQMGGQAGLIPKK